MGEWKLSYGVVIEYLCCVVRFKECYMIFRAEGPCVKALEWLVEMDSNAQGPCVKAYGNSIYDSQVLRDH